LPSAAAGLGHDTAIALAHAVFPRCESRRSIVVRSFAASDMAAPDSCGPSRGQVAGPMPVSYADVWEFLAGCATRDDSQPVRFITTTIALLGGLSFPIPHGTRRRTWNPYRAHRWSRLSRKSIRGEFAGRRCRIREGALPPPGGGFFFFEPARAITSVDPAKREN